ncbi:MAG TPA: alpha/beta hydrolase [Humibacter sp.]|nr:alpha/beta hydrolase [Humibacter sp.]
MNATATTARAIDLGNGLQVTIDERGGEASARGTAILLLHGGAGPQSVAGLAAALGGHARVVTPVHPGFDGTPRPPWLDSAAGLADAYLDLLDALALDAVTVIGNSIGGWIAAELAALGTVSVARLVVIDGAGLDLAGHPTADFFSLTFDQLAELSYARPDVFRIDPTALPEPARAAMAGNRSSLLTYAGSAMVDPTLASRLATIAVPTLVVWGDHDRMIDVAVGEAFANAIPGARFELLANTGHLPQLETPDAVVSVLDGFL